MTEPVVDGTRFVESADGTTIAVQVSGRGRPLVLVHGTSSEHTTWRLVRPLLDERVTTYAVERRGRGASGDAPDYSLALESADVAAVVRSAAQTHGEPVDLLGHSFGGNVAYDVATDCADLRRLVLYEGWPTPDPAHRTFDAELLDELDEPAGERSGRRDAPGLLPRRRAPRARRDRVARGLAGVGVPGGRGRFDHARGQGLLHARVRRGGGSADRRTGAAAGGRGQPRRDPGRSRGRGRGAARCARRGPGGTGPHRPPRRTRGVPRRGAAVPVEA